MSLVVEKYKICIIILIKRKKTNNNNNNTRRLNIKNNYLN